MFPFIERIVLAHTGNAVVEAAGKLILAIWVLLLHFCPGQDVDLLSTDLEAEVDLVLVEMFQHRLAQIFQSLRPLTIL